MAPIYLVSGVLLVLLVLDNFNKGSIIKVQKHEINIRETHIARLEHQIKKSEKQIWDDRKQFYNATNKEKYK